MISLSLASRAYFFGLPFATSLSMKLMIASVMFVFFSRQSNLNCFRSSSGMFRRIIVPMQS